MNVRSEKNLDGDEGGNADAEMANVIPPDFFDGGEQTLIRPDRHHHDDLERSVDDSERERIEVSDKTSEHSEANAGEEQSFNGTYKSDTKSDIRRKEQFSLAKQSKNAMMSSISPSKEHFSSKTKMRLKTFYDERKISLQADGQSDTDFTPSPKQEKNKKAIPT